MSIRQMRALDAIGRHGTFAVAARALNLTQSAVSMQINALEQALGVPLFDRSRRPPRLTSAGEIAMRRAKVIVAEYDEMVGAIDQTHAGRLVFRFGAIPTVLSDLLPKALIRLRTVDPQLSVNVSSDLSGSLIKQVASGELDAALIHEPHIIKEGLIWREVKRQRVVVVAPPESRATDAAAVFKAHPYIRFNRNAWVAPMIEARLAELNLMPETRAEIQSIEAIHSMVRLGFGASILPEVGTIPIAGPDFRSLDFGPRPIFRTVGLISRSDRPKRQIQARVLDALRDIAEDIDRSNAKN